MSITVGKNIKLKLRNALLVVLVLYVMIGGLLYAFQEKLLFLPEPLDKDYAYSFEYPFEELFLKTDSDGLINALHFRVKNADPKGVILYFHGNAGNLSRWGTVTEYFVEKQYEVLVIDYRTYGKSKGQLKESYFYSDAQHSYNYLKSFYDESEITLYGRSLGTGIASYLASTNMPKQLILESPYYNIADVAENRFPVFPVKSLLKYEFPNNEFLPQVQCPTTIFHGTEDHVVPYSSGKKLYELGLKNVDLIPIEGGGHNNLINFDQYHKGIDNILN